MTTHTHIEWLERWLAPGVCLLARAQVSNRGLVGMIANRLMSPSGIWLFAHGRQAALIDAPFAWEDSAPVIRRIEECLRSQDLQLKYVAASHLHLDHSAGLSLVLDHFPEAAFVYPDRWRRLWITPGIDRIKCGVQPSMSRQWDRLPQHAYASCFVTELANEPLHFLAAPYHSPTDQLAVFRGVALLPDWHLPASFDEPLRLVDAPVSDVTDTIALLHDFRRDTGYEIRQSCAVHGDEPLRSDFQKRLEIAFQRFVAPVRRAEFGT